MLDIYYIYRKLIKFQYTYSFLFPNNNNPKRGSMRHPGPLGGGADLSPYLVHVYICGVSNIQNIFNQVVSGPSTLAQHDQLLPVLASRVKSDGALAHGVWVICARKL